MTFAMDGLFILTSLMINLVIVVNGATNLPGHFFPVDDSYVTRLTGAETSGPVSLASNFTLFSKTTNVINVNENGVLSFPTPMLESIVRQLWPFRSGKFVAVFWTDNMPVFENGKITYAEYTQSTGSNVVDMAKHLVNGAYSCFTNFQPESVFVATWHDVHTRFECVLAHSIEYCQCLASDKHYGDTVFCKCREKHSESYCRECELGPSAHLKQFCKCLDSKDDLDYCTCKENKRNGADVTCKCLRDHDSHYCDCLEASNSPEHAWNCSCRENHSEKKCNCLRTYDNEGFCSCREYFGPGNYNYCDCYLFRQKEFCDCYRLHQGYEGYCDCVEQGKGEDYCECVRYNHLSHFDDVYLAETFCDCFLGKNATNRPYMSQPGDWQYCTCVASSNEANCVHLKVKRDLSLHKGEICYLDAPINGLVKEEGSTYQVALVTGGGISFVVFNYGYWSQGMHDFYKRHAKDYYERLMQGNFHIGMMAANRDNWSTDNKKLTIVTAGNHPYVHWCLPSQSTHGVPGQLIFRVDQVDIVQPPCEIRNYFKWISP